VQETSSIFGGDTGDIDDGNEEVEDTRVESEPIGLEMLEIDYGKKSIQILVDSGSSHDFLDVG